MASSPASLVPRCGHCQSTTSLLRCSRCKVQRYCNPEHQAADFPFHKSACKGALEYLIATREVIEQLRDPSVDGMITADPFGHSIGQTSNIIGMQAYLRCRQYYVEQLTQIKTYDSVVVQLDTVMDCLRLCRGNEPSLLAIGVREMAPHLMLRLDMDQEAYDFVKWWQTTAQEPDIDWETKGLGYLDVKDANCFETVGYLCRDGIQLSHTSAVVLLKVKMMLDLMSLQESLDGQEVPTDVPGEILNKIRDHSVRSPVIKANKEVMESKDQKDRIDELVKQVKVLYKVIDKANSRFWPALLSPNPALERHTEVQQVLRFAYDAWMETPGAIEVVRSMAQT